MFTGEVLKGIKGFILKNLKDTIRSNQQFTSKRLLQFHRRDSRNAKDPSKETREFAVTSLETNVESIYFYIWLSSYANPIKIIHYLTQEEKLSIENRITSVKNHHDGHIIRTESTKIEQAPSQICWKRRTHTV